MNNGKNNVINISDRLKKKAKQKTSEEPKNSRKGATEVIDITEHRNALIASERRRLARTVLSQFIGVFAVIPEKGLQPISLYDISSGGLAFDMPMEAGEFTIGEAVTMRIYLSHDTYFSFSVKVANLRAMESKGTMRHGAIFSHSDTSYKTLFYFIKFLESVSLVARKDTGDRLMGRVD